MKPLLSLITLLLSHCLYAESTSWPKRLQNTSALPKVIAHKSDIPPFLYETKSFRFLSDKKLDYHKVREFAKSAESVPAAIKRIPLPLLQLPQSSDAQKPAIHIFSDLENYTRAGGVANSAGYYSGRQKAVFLRADQFIDLPQGRSVNYKLLVHELSHLCNDGFIGYTPAWFYEGNAEYFSAAFIPKGSYQFENMTDRVKNHIKQHLNQSSSISVPPLKQLLTMSSSDWREFNALREPEQVYHLYAISLILTHHFYHQTSNGRSEIKSWLAACQKRSRHSDPFPQLIAENQLSPLETQLTNFWKSKGIKIAFQ
ncbi:hypothetical protein [Rubritalea tangerina]|uniref:DUF1570 domain-containing protein n=1 Tax=Rubritalea tangerina TaxID=430798 RepID=A0ABW4Z9W0_9BACT